MDNNTKPLGYSKKIEEFFTKFLESYYLEGDGENNVIEKYLDISGIHISSGNQ